jgi:DNA-directed RNA polymerase specialized sigma24 family protein
MRHKSDTSQGVQWAEDVEVWAAVESLSDAATRRLERSATWRFEGLPHAKRFGRSPEDLLCEVIVLTLGKDRRWNKKFSFERHLKLQMRSLASQWKRKKKELDHELDRSSDDGMEEGDDAENHEPRVEGMASPNPDPERILEVRQQLNRAKAAIADISHAHRVCKLVAEQWTAAEIARELEMPVQKIETLLKRIRDRSRKIKMLERGAP